MGGCKSFVMPVTSELDTFGGWICMAFDGTEWQDFGGSSCDSERFGASRTAFAQQGTTIHLPTSRQLATRVPGDPKRLNMLPMSTSISPEKWSEVTLNIGYGNRTTISRWPCCI